MKPARYSVPWKVVADVFAPVGHAIWPGGGKTIYVNPADVMRLTISQAEKLTGKRMKELP